MTRQPFNHDLRLKRASEHLQSIEAEVRRWREEHPYRTYVKFDKQSGEKSIIAESFGNPSCSDSYVQVQALEAVSRPAQ